MRPEVIGNSRKIAKSKIITKLNNPINRNLCTLMFNNMIIFQGKRNNYSVLHT